MSRAERRIYDGLRRYYEKRDAEHALPYFMETRKLKVVPEMSSKPLFPKRGTSSMIQREVERYKKRFHPESPITGNSEVDALSLDELRFDPEIRRRFPMEVAARVKALSAVEAMEFSTDLLTKRLERQRKATARRLTSNTIDSDKVELSFKVEMSTGEGEVGDQHKSTAEPDQRETLRDYTGETPDATSAGQQAIAVDNAQWIVTGKR